MNHIFRSIWCPHTRTCVATSEHATGPRKSAASVGAPGAVSHTLLAQHSSAGLGRWQYLPMALMLAWGGLAQANPTGGVVSAGSAAIGGTSGRMTITQTTPNVAIQWQSFGIGAGQSVQFV